MSIRIILGFISLIFILIACSPISKSTVGDNESVIEDKKILDESQQASQQTPTSLIENQNRQKLLEHIVSGGPPPDGIPPIEGGKYESIEEADKWLSDSDQVFLLETNNRTYLFPQRVLVWHEIVNVKDGDFPFSLTYCPLTGSAICYFYPDGYDTSYGTSGRLINSNLLMYDRATNAYISQIDGVGLNKDLEGVVLNSTPVFWLDWSVAKTNFKEARVLSTDTGFLRNYNQDPYGTYGEAGPTGYYANQGTIFEPIHRDSKALFPDKYPVIGIKKGDDRLALDEEIIKLKGHYLFDFGDSKVLAIHDIKLDIVRLYYISEGLSIEILDNQIVANNGETWDIQGKKITADKNLEVPQYFEVMWFAWFAFYPDTEVIQ